MKSILEKILAAYARAVLRINHPRIIGITGSVGKSSTKEAVALVLSEKFSVRASPGNLNSQLGLPLAILGFQKSGGFTKSLATVISWVWILISGFFRIFQFNYPEILVLEMGTDRPGDIKYLLSISGKLDVAVITDIGISHLQYFNSEDALKREKLSLLSGLKKQGLAVLNTDNPKVADGKHQFKGQVSSYGFNPADLQATDYALTKKNEVPGTAYKLNYGTNRVPVFIPYALGRPVVYSTLAAAGVGLWFGMHLVEISQALEKYRGPAGRLRIISGINDSTIIDDTYNAAPSSTIAALEALQSFPGLRKLVALGHMAELGEQTESGHRSVAAKIVELGISSVFLIGEKTKYIEDELSLRKYAGRVAYFPDSEAAAKHITTSLYSGDVLLVKGSQSARTEKIVKACMKNPGEAKHLLVRQSSEWLT